METFHLLHLASVWNPRAPTDTGATSATIPPTRLPVVPVVSLESSARQSQAPPEISSALESSRIRAAAVQMIFANRKTQDFIEPSRVAELETWSGNLVLEALAEFPI